MHKRLTVNILRIKIKRTCKASRVLRVSFVLLFFLNNQLQAQRPPGVGGDPSNSNYPSQNAGAFPKDSTEKEDEEAVDTSHINYFFADNLGRFYPENDSLLNNNFQQFDPARRRQLDYFNLGNNATAAYPSVYQPLMHRGLDVGMHQFDIYQIKNSDIRFYQQTKAFTDAFYSANQQANSNINIRFGRNFANGLNFSVDWRQNSNFSVTDAEVPTFAKRLNDTAQTWLYQGLPRGKTAALGMGFWWHQEKYDGFFTFTANLLSQLDKGGILADSVFRKRAPSQTLQPVLTNAQTRHERYEVSFLQYFKLNRGDSTGTKRSYLASHQIAYKSAYFQASDPFATTDIAAQLTSDSLFYNSLLNDPRGVRFYFTEKQIENNFNISTTRVRTEGDSVKKIVGQNDWLEVGISHSYHLVYQEVIKQNYNNVILRGRWNFTPNDNLKVETYAHFNILGYNIGDYRLGGELFFNLKNLGSLNVKAVSQLYEPTLIQSELYLTQRPVWENDFKKTLETNLSGTLAIPRLGFAGTVAYTLLNNYVYFDKTTRAAQAGTPLSILQLIVNQNFTLGKIHLDNTIAFQKPSENFLRLPDISTKSSLYLEGKIFKKAMLTRLGFDVRYNSTWAAPAYMPLTGQFFTQETGNVKAHPIFDVFLSIKVSSFRFFAKMDNLLGGFNSDTYYQIYNYPVPEGQFRFGIRWQFSN